MSDPLDDEIDLLARALQGETDGTSPEADRTLRAILAAPAPRRAPQAWLLAAAVLLVALVGAPTAWAWWTGRLGIGASDEQSGTPRERAPDPVAARPARTRVEVEPEPEPVAAPAPAPSIGTAVPAPTRRAAPAAATGTAPDAIAEAAQPSELEASEDPDVPGALPPIDPAERRAYEEAHALHFEAHAPAAALGAWDGYLTRYPNGRFSVEARYNRALTLVRLGRRDEAREALTPFADGSHGEYRRREASELIDALASEP